MELVVSKGAPPLWLIHSIYVSSMRLSSYLPFLLTLFQSAFAIKCIVRSAVDGLVEEECPPSAIGCRILFEDSTIVWYQPSHLYDRNQMVCLRGREHPQGCERKPSGHIRCWCKSDSQSSPCNTHINSHSILNEFLYPSTTPLPTTSSSSLSVPYTTQLQSRIRHHPLSSSHSNSSSLSSAHSVWPSISLSSTLVPPLHPSILPPTVSIPPYVSPSPSLPPNRPSRRMGLRTTESTGSYRSEKGYSSELENENGSWSSHWLSLQSVFLLILSFHV